jgi:hypothetical protein
MLTELHTELLAYLSGKLPGVMVEAFSPEFLDRNTTSLPGCWLELVEINPADEFGNPREMSKVSLQWEFRVLVDPLVSTGWTDIKGFALMIMWALRAWVPQTETVGPMTVKRAVPDEFKPLLDGYLVWLIEAEQDAWIDYTEDEVLPTLSRVTVADNHNNTSVIE